MSCVPHEGIQAVRKEMLAPLELGTGKRVSLGIRYKCGCDGQAGVSEAHMTGKWRMCLQGGRGLQEDRKEEEREGRVVEERKGGEGGGSGRSGILWLFRLAGHRDRCEWKRLWRGHQGKQ